MSKILKIIFVGIFSIFLLPSVFANTEVSGTISQDTTWTLANSPYIVTNNITFSANYTLTIEPWVVVKFVNSRMIYVYGTIIANWTESQKIIFTSVNDHSTEAWWNNGYWTWSPASWQWRNIRIYNPTSNNSILNHVKIQYGSWTDWYPLYLYNTNSVVSNTTIQYSNWDGIYINWWNSTLDSNIIREFWTYWVRINAWNTTLTNNLIDIKVILLVML